LRFVTAQQLELRTRKTHQMFLSHRLQNQADSDKGVVFLYGLPTNCYVAYTVIRRNIVFICSASYAVYNMQNWIHVDC